MLFSSIPVLAIKTNTESFIMVNGAPLGTAAATTYTALPIGAEGEYFITAQPISNPKNAIAFPTTRRLCFKRGELTSPVEDGAEVIKWPNNVFELVLNIEQLNKPLLETKNLELDRLTPMLLGKRLSFTLYYEQGLKLLIEDAQGIIAEYLLDNTGNADITAVLSLENISQTQFVAVKISYDDRNRLVLIDENAKEKLDVTGEHILIEETAIIIIEVMDTEQKHEKRKAYAMTSGKFTQIDETVGFFTKPRPIPKNKRQTAKAFFEAVQHGLEAEALSYLADDLAKSMTLSKLKDYFGEFLFVRHPLINDDGGYIGLLRATDMNLYTASVYELTFNELELLDNMAEVTPTSQNDLDEV